MPVIEREDARKVVKNALRSVADFTGDFEQFTFRNFRSYHKTVFLDSIKTQLNAERLDERSYLDIPLADSSFRDWDTLGTCIDWVVRNTRIRISRSNLTLGQDQLEG